MFRHLTSWAPGFERLDVRAPGSVTGVVVHRIEVSQEDPSYGDGPAEVARFFREHPVGVKATGGAMPYAILIEADGTVTQALPLDRVAPHAVSHNPTTVGVGVVGDFRGRAPTPAQLEALQQVLVGLVQQLGCGIEAVVGHDELRGGSRDPDKVCPGDGLALDPLRHAVTAALRQGAAGVRFSWDAAAGAPGRG